MKKILICMLSIFISSVTLSCESMTQDLVEYQADNDRFKILIKEISENPANIKNTKKELIILRDKKIRDVLHMTDAHKDELGWAMVITNLSSEYNIYSKAIDIAENIEAEIGGER